MNAIRTDTHITLIAHPIIFTTHPPPNQPSTCIPLKSNSIHTSALTRFIRSTVRRPNRVCAPPPMPHTPPARTATNITDRPTDRPKERPTIRPTDRRYNMNGNLMSDIIRAMLSDAVCGCLPQWNVIYILYMYSSRRTLYRSIYTYIPIHIESQYIRFDSWRALVAIHLGPGRVTRASKIQQTI